MGLSYSEYQALAQKEGFDLSEGYVGTGVALSVAAGRTALLVSCQLCIVFCDVLFMLSLNT